MLYPLSERCKPTMLPSHPALQLRALGTVALTDDAGRPLEDAVGRPKQLAVLLYLLLAEPRGMHRRDTVLAMLWPELSEDRARIALNKATHGTRKLLGGDVMIRPSDQELGVAFHMISCDAVQFVDAAAEGDHSRALDLYQGELLPGFHVSDAPEFMQWLDERRLALRRQAIISALDLAHQYRHSNPARAIECARRARDIDPFAESALRAELSLLDARGDRAEAMREFQRFAERLAAEYEAEPAPETTALVASIRDRTEAGAFERLTPPTPMAAPEVRPRSRRFLVSAVALVTVAAAGVMVAMSATPSIDRATIEAAESGTTSRDAVQAYLDGERAYRAGSFAASAEAFQRAVELDREFALAWWKLSMASRWSGDPALVASALDRASQRMTRLPPGVQQHVRALALYDGQRYEQALALYEQILRDAPRDADALNFTAEIYFHFGDSQGKPTASSEPYWRRVVELRPRDAGALIHLTEIAAMAGDRDAFERWASELRPDSLDVDRRVLVRVLRAFVFGDDLARREAVRDLPLVSAAERDALFQRVAAAAPDPHVFSRLLAPVMYSLGAQRQWIHHCEVWLAAGSGRTADVRALIDRGEILGRERWPIAASMVAMPHLEFDRGWALSVLDSLALEARGAERTPLSVYVEVIASLRLGEASRAERATRRLERGPFAVGDTAAQSRLTRLLRARTQLVAGDVAGALATLGPPTDPFNYRMKFPAEQERLMRAEAAERLGDLAAARRWYETFPDQSVTDISLLPWIRYRQGLIDARRGDGRAAQRQFERAAAALAHADAGAGALRADVRAKLP